MKSRFFAASIVLAMAMTSFGQVAQADSFNQHAKPFSRIDMGPRPFFLLDKMEDSALKRRLQRCQNMTPQKTQFSIGHRGAALQFPEHTEESYRAAARMGAGILECDVTFTQDKELVCRHSQCDLHTTTNILATPLAAKCSKPFTPAQYDASGKLIQSASAMCCTSDITVAEFKTLRGKMDAANPTARTVQEYLGGTANFRTDLYAGPSSGTLLTHQESIALFRELGTKMTPELKSASVKMPFDGFTQQQYAQKMIDEYKSAGVSARHVFAQSFDLNDVLYWIDHEPAFGQQAVYLDDIDPSDDINNNDLPLSFDELRQLRARGVNIVAPPMWALLSVDSFNRIVPSAYAKDIKRAKLDIITWSLERSGILADGDGGWYYQSINSGLKNEGSTFEALHVLARDVGVRGVFSDWPATTTYYASCMGLN